MPVRPILYRTALMGVAGLMATGLVACGGSSGGSTDPQSLLNAGIAAQKKGDLNAARQLYQQLLAKDPKNYYAHYNLGVIAQSQNDTSTALAQYGQALAANPNYVPALFNEATIYGTTNWTLAVTTYQQIIKIQPKAPTAYLNMGLLEAAHHQLKQADKDLTTALQQDPTLAPHIPPKLLKKVGRSASGQGSESSSPSATPSPSSS